MINKNIWLIGSGLMAIEYIKVLQSLNSNFQIIGRGIENVNVLEEKTKLMAISGGLQNFLNNKPSIPEFAIVAVGIEALSEVTAQLIKYGIKKILVEKPAVAFPNEINELSDLSKKHNAEVIVAYNRRFYASVLKAKEIIENDGGVTSFNFEFTEWSHVIRDLKKTQAEHHNWFLGNSTHLIDLSFYLGGKPIEISCFTKGSLNWHPKSSVFAGAGISENGTLFSYQANWESPGRWGLEVLTKKHRLIFRPVEKLSIQNIGSVAIEPVELEDKLDIDFKPGLYLQTKAFLEGNYEYLCNINEQKLMINTVYNKMSNY